MKFNTVRIKSTLVFLLCLIGLGNNGIIVAQSSIWVNAYYAGWQQGYHNSGYLPAQNVDYSAVTHINHFSLVPRSDGTLDDASNSVTVENTNALIPLAHAAGVKVLITVGGWGSNVAFRGSTSPAHLHSFIANLVTLMRARGYDGIDIDWEVLEASDSTQYKTFITTLRADLDTISPRPLLTAATAWQPAIFATLAGKFDQINLMSYDLSGAWPGWVTWHNSPVSDGGYNFPSTGRPVPSANGMVQDCINAGIPVAKLGIGIDFYGYIWSGGQGTPNGGVTDPRQSWISAPSVYGNVAYSTIMDNYYQPQYHRLDTAAQVSYLSIDNPGSANDKFISYDDEITCYKKINYARTKGIGGVILWELGGGYRANMPAGYRDPLLQAVKKSVNGSFSYDSSIPIVSITSPSNGFVATDTITLSATAADPAGIVGVQFRLNGSNIGTVIPSPPYRITWNSAYYPNGAATLSAVSWDTAGNSAVDSISVNLSNVHPPPPVFTYQTAWQDSFNRPNQRPLSGGKWAPILNFPGNGSMEIVNNVIQPYNSNGYGSPGGVACDTLLAKGSGAALTLTRKAGDGQFTSLFIYARMSSKDFNTGNGYRFRYMDVPNGTDILSIQIVTHGTNGFDLAATNYEVNVGDTLKFIVQNDSTNTLVAYVNSRQVLSAIDTTYNPPTGYVWLASFMLSTIPQFDNFSIINSVVSTPLSIPKAPVLLFPADNTNGLTLNPTLIWNSSPTATSYRIQAFTSPSFTSPVLDTTGITGASYTLDSLFASTTYYWRVNAANSAGTSDWSDVWYFVTGSGSTFSYTFNRRWNLVSLPILPINPGADVQFPFATSYTYEYIPNSGYNAEDTLDPGNGYWVKFNEAQKVSFTGDLLLNDTIDVVSGWNLIGSISRPVTIHSILSLGTSVSSKFFGFNGGYVSGDTIVPSRGYWVKVSSAGKLVLTPPPIMGAYASNAPQDDMVKNFTALTINDNAGNSQTLYFGLPPNTGINLDQFELPPLPPKGVFDARFSTGRYVEFESPDTIKNFPIAITNASYPATITCNGFPASAGDAKIVADNQEFSLAPGGKIILSHAPSILMLRCAASSMAGLPDNFQLLQNYPNPFNPATLIKYYLPVKAKVTLQIYNVLGEVVATLVNDVQPAGYRSIQWHAENNSSGIYFYRLQASGVEDGTKSFMKVLKMALIK
ncbi:MAG: glycosyl hydrolase family 18 protein [Bacteroidota bacterium]